MEDFWKDIEGFEGLYQISNLGRVKSLSRMKKSKHGTMYMIKEKFLIHRKDKYGYFKLILSNNGKQFNKFSHRLVAESFIPNINNKPCVNHIDGNKQNNSVENLEWCTNKENTQHALKTGLLNPVSGENHFKTNLTALDVKEIKKLIANGASNNKIAKKFNVHRNTITKIKIGARWAAIKI